MLPGTASWECAGMEIVFWLMVMGYLMVSLGELIPTHFRCSDQGLQADLAVCLAALGYALSWPLRIWREVRGIE